MELQAQCSQCGYLNTFDQEELLKQAEIYKPIKPSLYHLPRVVIQKCKACACKIKIKL